MATIHTKEDSEHTAPARISDAWCEGKKFSFDVEGKTVARAYLFICRDDEHSKPFGLLSGVETDTGFQKRGFGTRIVEQVIQNAKEAGCYKLLATSRDERPEVHAWYIRLGFFKFGKEFRMDFK